MPRTRGLLRAKKSMPPRSNKGGATRGKARAAQVKSQKIVREGISGMSVDANGRVTNAGKKKFTYRSR